MKDKMFFDIVFCVVIYRNTEDVINLLKSIRDNVQITFKVVIVNNYYNDDTEDEVIEVCNIYNCDFIHSENKGYGCGNNSAIMFALEKYHFGYLVIANPDTVIQSFEWNKIKEIKGIIAPEITNMNGKLQNPMNVFDIPVASKLIYKGLKLGSKWRFYGGLFIYKCVRKIAHEIYKFGNRGKYRIYMAHGSFLLMDIETLKCLLPVYDENMFLFAEESYLAMKAKKKNINTWYTDAVRVVHKEDGSMRFRDDINEQLKISNIYVYENYYLSKEMK